MKHLLRQTQCFKCSLCGKLLLDGRRGDALLDVVLYGAVNYAVCPNCLLPHSNPDDPEWIKKVDYFLERNNPENEEKGD